MSGSGETTNAGKYDKGTATTPDQGEEVKKMNTLKRRGNQSFRSTEPVQLHIEHIYFKGNTLGVGSVLSLLSKIMDIETAFDNFIEKLKSCV